jgi:hypothetical protein
MIVGFIFYIIEEYLKLIENCFSMHENDTRSGYLNNLLMNTLKGILAIIGFLINQSA